MRELFPSSRFHLGSVAVKDPASNYGRSAFVLGGVSGYGTGCVQGSGRYMEGLRVGRLQWRIDTASGTVAVTDGVYSRSGPITDDGVVVLW